MGGITDRLRIRVRRLRHENTMNGKAAAGISMMPTSVFAGKIWAPTAIPITAPKNSISRAEQ
ncbi:MAG: hypothetical protein CMM86_07845 [Rhodovulum sp.]|nr:hypothetical protein [Rhodovulum sp.]